MSDPNFSFKASLTTGVIAIAALAFAALNTNKLLIYNPSDSIPVGFYMRDGSELARGSVVVIRSIHAAPDYATKRNFTDAGDRFLKRIAALEGDNVCAEDRAISVNGALVAERMRVDSSGDPLPSWTGCVTLNAGQVFLLGDHPGSFDGRYWGISDRADLIGPWRPLR